MFRIGQKIVCVDGKPRRPRTTPHIYPVKGEIYTVRAIHRNLDAVLLEEIINYPRYYSNVFGELHWFCDRFRPIVKIGDQVCKEIAEDIEWMEKEIKKRELEKS